MEWDPAGRGEHRAWAGPSCAGLVLYEGTTWGGGAVGGEILASGCICPNRVPFSNFHKDTTGAWWDLGAIGQQKGPWNNSEEAGA